MPKQITHMLPPIDKDVPPPQKYHANGFTARAREMVHGDSILFKDIKEGNSFYSTLKRVRPKNHIIVTRTFVEGRRIWLLRKEKVTS